MSMYQLAVNERRLLAEFPAFFYDRHRAKAGGRVPWDIRLDGGGHDVALLDEGHWHLRKRPAGQPLALTAMNAARGMAARGNGQRDTLWETQKARKAGQAIQSDAME